MAEDDELDGEFEGATWGVYFQRGVRLIHGRGRKYPNGRAIPANRPTTEIGGVETDNVNPTNRMAGVDTLLSDFSTRKEIEPRMNEIKSALGIAGARSMDKPIEPCAKCGAKFRLSEPHSAIELCQVGESEEVFMNYAVARICPECTKGIAPRVVAMAQFIASARSESAPNATLQ